MIDVSPLLRGASGTALRVAGVAAGEAAILIDRAALARADGQMLAGWSQSNGKVHWTDAAGTRSEVPLATLGDEVIAGGGFLRVDAVAIRVDSGVVTRIFVRGSPLMALGIRREADVERVLGSAEGQSLERGCRVFHYPKRMFALGWHRKDGRVEHLALGADPWQEPRFGAPELLRESLAAFPTLAPSGWARPSQSWLPGRSSNANNPVTVARYQRLSALGTALGVGTPATFVKGEFLQGELHLGQHAVLDELAALGGHEPRRFAPSLLFTHLLHYRNDVERVITATSGWLECSDGALLGMIATQNRLGREIGALMTDVDRWLRTLIDPEARTFEQRDLVARFGWPDVDLHELEMDSL